MSVGEGSAGEGSVPDIFFGVRHSELRSWSELSAATGGAALVRHEVGPDLIAPAHRLGDAVLFLREIQSGALGAVVLGPDSGDIAELLGSPWQSWPGYRGVRGVTVERANHRALEEVGARGLGLWSSMAVSRDDLVRRPVPEGIHPDSDVDRQEARAFVDAHYSSKWLAPHPVGETWVGLRDDAGILRATGLAAVTPAGVVRLSGITVPAAERGRGLGRAVTQDLVEHGLTVADEVTLGVDDDNHAARVTYSRMGFRVSHDFSSGLLVPAKGRSQ